MYSCSREMQSRSTDILGQRNALPWLQTGAERVLLQGWVPHSACEEIPSVSQMSVPAPIGSLAPARGWHSSLALSNLAVAPSRLNATPNSRD